MYKPDTKDEKLNAGLSRLYRLYNHYEKMLNCTHFSIYYQTIATLNKLEKKINRYEDKIREAHNV